MSTMNHAYILYSAQQSRMLDQLTGIDGFTLMQKAGAAIFSCLLQRWPQLKDNGSIHVFCGAGNNAGDGYIIAHHAQQLGLTVKVTALKNPQKLTGDALLAWKLFEKDNGEIALWEEASCTIEETVIVDALLGTGIQGTISETYAKAIQFINQSKQPVLSVDIPSGLCANTGKVAGYAIQADTTVTVICQKQGLHTADGPQCIGKLLFEDLGIPNNRYKKVKSNLHLLAPGISIKRPKPRINNSHKGSYGSLLLIGGDTRMGGAILMAAESALASGVGSVSVLTKQAHTASFLARCPELMIHAYETTSIESLLDKKSAIVIGPGLGLSQWGKSLLQKLKNVDLPILFDADALNHIAIDNHLLSASTKHVFTPHPGEAARLLQQTVSHVQADRIQSVMQLQTLLKGSIVLKGSGSIVANKDTIGICPYGNGAMAVAGCGDILAGLIGGLMAQGYDAYHAAALGTWLHALAGDKVALEIGGKIGLKATELIPIIRQLINSTIDSNIKQINDHYL